MGHDARGLWDRVAAIFTAIGAVGTLIAILVSIHLTSTQINEARDEVRMQHLVEEAAQFDEPPLLTTRQTVALERIRTSKNEAVRPMTYDDAPPEVWDLLNDCDHIGLLARRGYLNVDDVWSEMGYWLLHIYADAEPVIEADREGDPASGRKGNPASMTNCSWLVQEMRPLEARKNNGVGLHLTASDLYDFYSAELDAKPGNLTTRRGAKR